MPIKIPRSEISTAGAARRTLLPGSEAGLVYRSFGQFADSATRLSVHLLGERMKEDQSVWDVKAKANFENAEMLRDQSLLELRNQEDLAPMDQEATLFRIFHEFADDIEEGEQEAMKGLLPRSRRILGKESQTRLEALRSSPGALLKAMGDTVDIARVELINTRALNNYGNSPSAGDQASADLAYAGRLVERGLLKSGQLQAVHTTVIGGIRSAYGSRGVSGWLDYTLELFDEPGSGGLSNLPGSIRQDLQAEILENPARYVGFTTSKLAAPTPGTYAAAPVPGIGLEFSAPPRLDLARAILWGGQLFDRGLFEESRAVKAAARLGLTNQSRVNQAGRDAVVLAAGFKNPPTLPQSLDSISSTPSDLDEALSGLPPGVLIGPNEIENTNSIAMMMRKFGGGMLPAVAEELSNQMGEGNLVAWGTAARLSIGVGALNVITIGEKSFKFSQADVDKVNKFRAYTSGGGMDPASALSVVMNPVDEELVARPTGREGDLTLFPSREAIHLKIAARNPKLEESTFDHINNVVTEHFLDGPLRFVAANLPHLNPEEKTSAALDMALTNYFTRHPLIERDDKWYANRLNLPFGSMVDANGNPATTNAWVMEELLDVIRTQGELQGVLGEFTDDVFWESIAPYLFIEPMSETLGEPSELYRISFSPTAGDFEGSPTGYIMSKEMGFPLIFAPRFDQSKVGEYSIIPKMSTLLSGIPPLERDTEQEIATIVSGLMVGASPDDFMYKSGTVGGLLERAGDAAIKTAKVVGEGLWFDLKLNVGFVQDTIVYYLFEKDQTFEGAAIKAGRDAIAAASRHQAAQMEGLKEDINIQAGRVYESSEIPPILLQGGDVRVEEFNGILESVATQLDPRRQDDPKPVTYGGREVELRPEASQSLAELRAASRAQWVGFSGDIETPEYERYVYEYAREIFRERLTEEFKEDPKGFMSSLSPATDEQLERLTPKMMRSMIKEAVRKVHSPGYGMVVPPSTPPAVGAFDPTTGRESPALKPLAVEPRPLPPLRLEAPIERILANGVQIRSLEGRGFPATVKRETEVWIRENKPLGSLLPKDGWTPPGSTTIVNLVQEVVVSDSRQLLLLSDALYGNLEAQSKERLFGEFGLIPGASSKDKKPGWLKRYYTTRSQEDAMMYGVDPKKELVDLKQLIASHTPGHGAGDIIMSLTNDQFFKLLEKAYKRYSEGGQK